MITVFLCHPYFLLKFFATFDSVLGLQISVGLQVNSGLQPPTRWEPFVAGTMLRRPEPTKERVEPTILSKIAIGIDILPGLLFYCSYEFCVICAVLTLPNGLRLCTVAGIWI